MQICIETHRTFDIQGSLEDTLCPPSYGSAHDINQIYLIFTYTRCKLEAIFARTCFHDGLCKLPNQIKTNTSISDIISRLKQSLFSLTWMMQNVWLFKCL